jgi:hypothetical protein
VRGVGGVGGGDTTLDADVGRDKSAAFDARSTVSGVLSLEGTAVAAGRFSDIKAGK